MSNAASELKTLLPRWSICLRLGQYQLILAAITVRSLSLMLSRSGWVNWAPARCTSSLVARGIIRISSHLSAALRMSCSMANLLVVLRRRRCLWRNIDWTIMTIVRTVRWVYDPAAFAAMCIPSASPTAQSQEYTTEDVGNSLIQCGI
jgi:hypothetical protein